ncbi:MAG TPA: fibronectin type III domain-containing protein, partial [Desulfuromonadaceae bacterium]
APSVPTPTVPAAPTGVAATGGTNQVTISWTAVSNATSYNIYWSTTTGVTTATGTKITGVSSPYVQTGLTASTTYYYIVTAVNSAGESLPSSQASATTAASAPGPGVPAAPTGVTATGSTNEVTVSWAAVTGATSYNLYWSLTTGVTTATGTKIAGVTSPFSHELLAANTTYFYIVTAANSAGESLPSSQVSATTSALDGVALYASNCAGCHGALASSSVHGRTAAQIQSAINANIGGMGSLSFLTPAQVQAIADVLSF